MSASTIYLIISGLPLIYYIYQFFRDKRFKSVEWDIDKGNRCYHCKEDLQCDKNTTINRLLSVEKYHTLCLSCKREIKILQLKSPVYRLKIKFQKFLLSENFKKVSLAILISIPGFLVLEAALSILFKINIGILQPYTFVNLLYCFLLHQKSRYTTIKKPSE